jgi:LmbE family N-acetylglucosaminyl deacetylase
MAQKTALAVVAHPDDIEFLMAGTLIRLRHAGYQIHYMNVSSGCLGSMTLSREETAAVRREESLASCQLLGATYHESICEDLEIFYGQPALARMTAVVRDVAPEILLTHSPSDYMEDHMNACRLAVTAAFGRGMPNFISEPPREATAQLVTVYHAQPYGNRGPLRDLIIPEVFVDTTDLVETKVQALACHASQKEFLDQTQGVDSYLQALRDLDREVGRLSGKFESAEGWRRHLHAGFCGRDDDPLRAALSPHISFRRDDDSAGG